MEINVHLCFLLSFVVLYLWFGMESDFLCTAFDDVHGSEAEGRVQKTIRAIP